MPTRSAAHLGGIDRINLQTHNSYQNQSRESQSSSGMLINNTSQIGVGLALSEWLCILGRSLVLTLRHFDFFDVDVQSSYKIIYCYGK